MFPATASNLQEAAERNGPLGWLPLCLTQPGVIPHIGAIFRLARRSDTCTGHHMQAAERANTRRQDRRKAVLAVRVRGTDAAGKLFDELAHTLDVTPSGARLGSIRHQLRVRDEVTVWHRQRKMEFRVVWTKKLNGITEYQVGLQAIAHDHDAWGLSPADFPVKAAALTSASALVSA